MTDIVEHRPEHRYDAYIEGGTLVLVDEIGPQQIMTPEQKPIGQRTTIIHDRVDLKDSEAFLEVVKKQVDELGHACVRTREQLKALENQGALELGPRLDDIIALGQKLSPGKAGMDKLERALKKLGPQATQWGGYKQASFNHEQFKDQHARASLQLQLIRRAMEGKNDGKAPESQHLAPR